MQMGMEIVGGGPVQSVRMLGTQQKWMYVCIYIHVCVIMCMPTWFVCSWMCVPLCMSVCLYLFEYLCLWLYLGICVCVYLHECVCLCIVCLCGPACVPASLCMFMCLCVATHISVQVTASVGGGWGGRRSSWYPRKGPLLLDFWLVSGSSGASWVWEPGRKVD